MAKRHMVKCFYCSKYFDANEEDFVQVNKVRYAHKICHEQYLSTLSKEELDKKVLQEYIKELFGYERLPPKVNSQIKDFKENERYTYSGILKTLKYFFEIRGNSLEKANGGIGIVPYVYQEARNFWANLEAVKKESKGLLSQPIVEVEEIHITSPKRKPMKHYRELFTFLNEKG